MLADGRLHLSAVALLASHLTVANRDTVLSRAVHRSKLQVQELVAELAPRPDVPSLIRKLPMPRVEPPVSATSIVPQPPSLERPAPLTDAVFRFDSPSSSPEEQPA